MDYKVNLSPPLTNSSNELVAQRFLQQLSSHEKTDLNASVYQIGMEHE
jgi:hypothetical protein